MTRAEQLLSAMEQSGPLGIEGGNGGRIWENADPDVTILKQAKRSTRSCNKASRCLDLCARGGCVPAASSIE
jgi:hypothetical protein